ncbi:MAG: hypothetical protein KGI75_12695 [Rhizobiaceae bacterium]|nr:hypothetical protein [Rhizobiaceae bacterium]
MSTYEEKRRFQCESDAGKTYVVIEQMRVSSRIAIQKTDYITDDGEIVTRLDDGHFLILLRDEVLSIRDEQREH